MSGLSNIYISKLLKDQLKVKTFRGVYSADSIPKSLLGNSAKSSCIVNLSNRDEKGSHFITLVVDEKSITVYDSLNLPTEVLTPDILKRLESSKKKIRYALKSPIQDISSSFCGFYCIFYVLMNAGEQFSVKYRIRPFIPKPHRKNDAIVIENIIQLIKNNLNKTMLS